LLAKERRLNPLRVAQRVGARGRAVKVAVETATTAKVAVETVKAVAAMATVEIMETAVAATAVAATAADEATMRERPPPASPSRLTYTNAPLSDSTLGTIPEVSTDIGSILGASTRRAPAAPAPTTGSAGGAGGAGGTSGQGNDAKIQQLISTCSYWASVLQAAQAGQVAS
jgi:hypothetical protein